MRYHIKKDRKTGRGRKMPDCREENQRGRLTLSFYEEEKIGSFLLLFHKKGIYRLTDFRFEKETTEEKRNETWQSLCEELYRRQIKLLLECRGAQNWFAEHPEQKELLANVKEKPGF